MYIYFFLGYIKMEQENITFSKNESKSYTMTDLHILGYNISLGTKILIIIMILMLIKYYYWKKVIENILLDIMMLIKIEVCHYK